MSAPTGTIFELDMFRERLERRASSVDGSTTWDENGEVQTGNMLAAELREAAAELKALIDNVQAQYCPPDPPSDDVIEVSNSEGDGFWCAPPSDEGKPCSACGESDCETCDTCGARVHTTCPTFWYADNELWNSIYGTPDNPRGEGVMKCIPCFTRDCEAAGVHVAWKPYDFVTSDPLEKLRHFMRSIGTTVTDGKDPDGTDFDVVDLAILTIQGEIDRNPFDHPGVRRLVDEVIPKLQEAKRLMPDPEPGSYHDLACADTSADLIDEVIAALPNQSTSPQKGTPNE